MTLEELQTTLRQQRNQHGGESDRTHEALYFDKLRKDQLDYMVKTLHAFSKDGDYDDVEIYGKEGPMEEHREGIDGPWLVRGYVRAETRAWDAFETAVGNLADMKNTVRSFFA